MKYLHTMVRVTDIEQSKRFYCDGLGLREVRRSDNEAGRYTLVFLAAPGDEDAQVELTFNWDPEVYTGGRHFGHHPYGVDDIYEAGRYTLVFLAAPGDEDAQVELTFNWDPEVYTGGRNFGHHAYGVDDIY